MIRLFQQGALSLTLIILFNGYCFGQLMTADVLPPRYNTNKKIIEYGWGYLDPAQVRDNMDSLSERPFDGLVLRPKWPQYSPKFNESIFYPHLVSEAFMELDTLASINWSSSLTDNFMMFWVAGYERADWFSDADWEIVTENCKLISKANSVARTKGIFFDPESYDGNTTWVYNTTLYPSHTLEQVEAKVRQRGKEFIQALETHSPDINVFCTLAWIGTRTGAPDHDYNRRQETVYCLLAAFCDGMLEGATGQSKIIDGNEIGYYYPYTINWHYEDGAYSRISENVFIASDLKSKQETNMQVAHGLYYKSYSGMSDPDTQKKLEHHVYEELMCSDEYMWFYSEEVESEAFWLNPFPPEAKAAILSAKNKIENGQQLGWTTSESGINVSNDLEIITPVQNQIFNIGDTITFSVQQTYSVRSINYFSSFKKVMPGIMVTPAIKQYLAVHPGVYLVYAFSNSFQKLSNPVTYYVREGTNSVNGIIAENSLVGIYPNPFSSSVTIQFANPVENVEAIILNLHGQKIKSINNISGEYIKIERGNLASGLYFIQLTKDGKVIATNKLLITD